MVRRRNKMGGNVMLIIDVFLFFYLLAGIINPSLWIQKPELKNNPDEQKKIRKIAIVLMAVEIVFCIIEYVL